MTGTTTGGGGTGGVATSSDGITIAGQSVLVDIDGEAQDWLDRFMPEAELFFDPRSVLDDYITGQGENTNTGSYFESTLPSLPPIKIGQLQWPCVGVSRYARALYLVDRIALLTILWDAWKHSFPIPDDLVVPEKWPNTNDRTVDVALNPDFTIQMFPLLPIKISDDLWILRLVDARYFCFGDCRVLNSMDALKPSKTWDELFVSFGGLPAVGHPYEVSFTAESGDRYGNPDISFRAPNVPLPFVIDTACFSVGCRPVVGYGEPTENRNQCTIQVACERPDAALTKKTIVLSSDKITGGQSSKTLRPSMLRASTRVVESGYSGNNRQFQFDCEMPSYDSTYEPLVARIGSMLRTKCVWNANVAQGGGTPNIAASGSALEFAYYIGNICIAVREWYKEEYYLTLPDIVSLDPGGFDDYIIYESSGDKKSTTVRSLPMDFFPPYLLGQYKAGAGLPTYWFQTSKPAITAKPISSVRRDLLHSSTGLRYSYTNTAQIQSEELWIPSGSSSGAFATFQINCVTGVLLPTSGSIGKYHLNWVKDMMFDGTLVVSYEGWLIVGVHMASGTSIQW